MGINRDSKVRHSRSLTPLDCEALPSVHETNRNQPLLNTLLCNAHLLADLSARILQIQSNIGIVHRKEDNSEVTKADILATRFYERLLPRIVEAPVLGEESITQTPSKVRRGYKEFWLTDGVDGTRSFVKGEPHYCSVAALLVNGTPRIGIALRPVTKTIYLAVEGCGAFTLDIENSQMTRIIRGGSSEKVTTIAGNSSALTVAEQEKQSAMIARNGWQDAQLLVAPSALKHIDLTCGVYDVAGGCREVHEWDVAAADCIAREAGCLFVRADTLQPILYNQSDDMMLPGVFSLRPGITVR